MSRICCASKIVQLNKIQFNNFILIICSWKCEYTVVKVCHVWRRPHHRGVISIYTFINDIENIKRHKQEITRIIWLNGMENIKTWFSKIPILGKGYYLSNNLPKQSLYRISLTIQNFRLAAIFQGILQNSENTCYFLCNILLEFFFLSFFEGRYWPNKA